jgi:excinuclease UvrABC nuclease subunit
LETGLDNINGIGPKIKELLLLHFKSVQKIKDAKPSILIQLIGEKKAAILIAAFGK